ncbi:hypothetical protein FKW77_001244 [Venturia effusa]|uniref:Uncharacterized protein n=1 Tax=Venturia effusa TaxID=50376 RepID=A0A517LGI3_9PEZI|nr:hypothetical protein FKW77_001244 [Venturia effusa]
MTKHATKTIRSHTIRRAEANQRLPYRESIRLSIAHGKRKIEALEQKLDALEQERRVQTVKRNIAVIEDNIEEREIPALDGNIEAAERCNEPATLETEGVEEGVAQSEHVGLGAVGEGVATEEQDAVATDQYITKNDHEVTKNELNVPTNGPNDQMNERVNDQTNDQMNDQTNDQMNEPKIPTPELNVKEHDKDVAHPWRDLLLALVGIVLLKALFERFEDQGLQVLREGVFVTILRIWRA